MAETRPKSTRLCGTLMRSTSCPCVYAHRAEGDALRGSCDAGQRGCKRGRIKRGHGQLEANVVEAVFVRVSPILTLCVRGQTIRTTPEHQIYVNGKGWICAIELGVGDVTISHDGQESVIESVEELGEVETVYNIRVANHHTYFVGGEVWGFSVWVHNARYRVVFEGGRYRLVAENGSVLPPHLRNVTGSNLEEFTGALNSVLSGAPRPIPGSPGIVRGGNSTELGRNLLEEMGLPRTASRGGYQAQHIVPSELRDHPVLQRIGMNLDDSSNGIFLPSARIRPEGQGVLPVHTGSHPNYTQALRGELDRLNVTAGVDDLVQSVHGIQQRARHLIQQGTPVRNMDGATVELWERLLRQ